MERLQATEDVNLAERCDYEIKGFIFSEKGKILLFLQIDVFISLDSPLNCNDITKL